MQHPVDRLRSLATPLSLVVVGLLWHGAWAAGESGPPQWDSAATWEVARHLATGEGAVTDAVWNLGWLPPALRHPSDLHWSPLPSRVLVPAMWVSTSWRAAQAVAVLVAALWGVLGWLWAGRLGLSGSAAWIAGALAATGLGALPFLGVPDSVGLFGLLGGAALLTASNGRVAATAALCALAALTRGDGFLLGVAVAVGLPGLRGLWCAAAGVGATGAWALRSWWVAGEGWVSMRGRVSTAESVLDLLRLQDPEPLSVADRLLSVVTHAPTAVGLGLLATGILPGLLALLALVFRRRDRSLWPLWVLPPLLAIAVYGLAPGVAEKGTFYRSFAAVLPAVAALGVVGALDLLRSLPRWIPAAMVLGSGALLAGITAAQLQGAFPLADDCGALEAAGAPAGAAVLAYEPVHVTARCARPALQIPLDATPRQLRVLADRYRIDWVVVAPEDHPQARWRADAVALDGFDVAGERVLRRAP
jgi:hypothetical protein